jgi:lipopolysaccharide/colanic/teichoic acid biosynthesis glycosyltransferase
MTNDEEERQDIKNERSPQNVALDEVAASAVGGETSTSVAGTSATGVAPIGGTVYVPQKKKRKPVYRFIKRVFDIVSSGVMLLLLSWFILLCLLIKWLEDFHNPVYVSKRVGKNGKIFNFYKIRTMRPDAEKLKQQLIDQGLNEADGPAFKMKNDPRITPVGKFYRKFSIDELLQLINIFNGTMSVVGPRPPIPKEVEAYTEEQKHRLDAKGGLLCLWQIQKNRNAITFDEWVRLDLEYIEKQSVWLDLKIIFKGAWMVVFDHSGE